MKENGFLCLGDIEGEKSTILVFTPESEDNSDQQEKSETNTLPDDSLLIKVSRSDKVINCFAGLMKNGEILVTGAVEMQVPPKGKEFYKGRNPQKYDDLYTKDDSVLLVDLEKVGLIHRIFLKESIDGPILSVKYFNNSGNEGIILRTFYVMNSGFSYSHSYRDILISPQRRVNAFVFRDLHEDMIDNPCEAIFYKKEDGNETYLVPNCSESENIIVINRAKSFTDLLISSGSVNNDNTVDILQTEKISDIPLDKYTFGFNPITKTEVNVAIHIKGYDESYNYRMRFDKDKKLSKKEPTELDNLISINTAIQRVGKKNKLSIKGKER